MLGMNRCLMTKQRRSFSLELRRNAVALVLDQNSSQMDACRSVRVADPFCLDGLIIARLEREKAI